MLIELTKTAALTASVVGEDGATDALERLTDAAERAAGAFARLADSIAGVASNPTGADVVGVESVRVTGSDLIDDVVRSNEIAADRSIDVWDGFGDRMVHLFMRLFDHVARDGQISFASLFDAIAPLVADLLQRISGIDLSGILGTVGNLLGGGAGGGLGGLIGGLTGGQGSGFGNILSAGSSLISMVSGSGGPLGGVFGGASGALAGAMPYIGAALTAAQIIGPLLFSRSPSVGPTTVARVSPATRDAIYTTDNGGDADALTETVEAIFEGIDRFQDRFGGVLNGNGFDIGYFPSPEDGSGQTGGYNFKAIIGAHAEEQDRFRGLSEAELITEAVKFIVQEGLDGIDVPEVAEAAKHSVAESLEDLFDDLLFAERFGALRAALDDAGEGADAYTVALQRQRQEIQETGRSLATDGVAAIRGFLDRVSTLFPGAPYLDTGTSASGEVSDIGSPIPGTDRTLLYERERGIDVFHPGVEGAYDDREGGLIGLDIGGEVLTFAGDTVRDEGLVVNPDPTADGQILLTSEGATIANEALEGLVATISDLGEQAADTVVRSQEYLDNQERVRDAFAIAFADVDALIGTIAGTFEPDTIGPFEERMIAGSAAIDQLEGELERINEDIAAATEVFPELGVAAIDVAERIEQATALLQAQLRADYNDQVSRDLREATGLGAQDEITDLAEEFGQRRADGVAIGVTDFSDLEDLYRQRIRSLLEGSDNLADIIGQVGGSLSDLTLVGDLLPGVIEDLRSDFGDDLKRDVREVRGLSLVDDVADRLSEHQERLSVGEALGVADLSGLDEILRDQLSGIFDPQALTHETVEALRIAYADNVVVMDALADALGQVAGAANDNLGAHLSLADATRLATGELNAQIEEQERLATTAERVIDTVADARRRIALDPDLSILSPEQQLSEARSYFESLAEQAATGDQDAQLELGTAAQDYLRLARDFYASNEDYARIFADVDAALGDTQSVAERQLGVAQAQLEELRAINRGLSGGLAELPNPTADFGRAPTRNRLIARLTGYSGNFGSGGFSAFRGGLSDALNQAVDMLVQAIPFADGGVMTTAGPLPLTRYGLGGIADSPQLALFGEGRMPEAFVPLPDGRTIPVTIIEPANDEPDGDGQGIGELIEETRRMTAAVMALRSDNASLRRGLDRVVAAADGRGRAA